MAIVPVRSPSCGFGDTENVRVPDPAPGDPGLTISQSTFAVAVHAHVGAEAVTITLPVPPPDGADSAAGAIENVHGGGGGAACDTVKVCPAIVSVPVRGAPGFA